LQINNVFWSKRFTTQVWMIIRLSRRSV